MPHNIFLTVRRVELNGIFTETKTRDMRPIISIGQRIDNGEWVEGYAFETIPETERCFIISNKSPYNDEVELNGRVVLMISDYNEVIPETITIKQDQMSKKLGQELAFSNEYHNGMSTRLYIATMAMQGLCVGKEAKDIKLGQCADIAELSLDIADELLKQDQNV